MGILTLGLLGVAAIFPVGSWYIQKATIADNGSAIAQSVMNDIITRGTVDPKAWYALIPTNLAPASHRMFSPDGKYAPAANRMTFTRPVAESMKEALNQVGADSDRTLIGRQFGEAFVIDPLYIAAAGASPASGPPSNIAAATFPAAAAVAYPRGTWAYYSAPEWGPWKATANSERVWPIRRVTLQGSTGWPIAADLASHFFRGGDDLTTDLPSRADRPARQNWDFSDFDGNGIPDALARQRTGDYSWIVCVVPTTSAARNGLARNPEGFSYDVSVVVFHKRMLPTESAATYPNMDGVGQVAMNERVVRASVISSGLNGGELFLEAVPDGITTVPGGTTLVQPFENLKVGQWIMLCGPHRNSNVNMAASPVPAGEPKFAMNWYQVMAIDSQPSSYITNPKTQRLVTVRGPQWSWLPTKNGTLNTNTELSNQLCVGIFRGAVAVHTKTVKLEGPHGAGMTVVKP